MHGQSHVGGSLLGQEAQFSNYNNRTHGQLCTCIIRSKLTAEFRQGQKNKVEQPGAKSMAKNTLVFGTLVNRYFSQAPDPLFETTSENCTSNYVQKVVK